jgi:hypothetical protein
MVNNFSPWVSMLRGQQVEQGQAQAELEGMDMQDRLARRRAGAAMGKSNYFTGYEGVPGANRPDFINQLFAEGDPEDALRLEAHHAEPFKIRRTIETAGEIERAKKEADMKVMTNAMREMFPDLGGGVAPASAPTEAVPGGADIAGIEPGTVPTAPPTRANLTGKSGAKRSMEMSLMGPKVTVEQMSPFDKEYKIDQSNLEHTKVDQTDIAENNKLIQNAHENARKVNEEIAATYKAMQTRDIPWEAGKAKIAGLEQNLAAFTAQRDQLLRGKQAPSAPAAPVAPAPAPLSPPEGPVGGLHSMLAPSIGPAPKFTSKEQSQIDVKNAEGRVTAANKEIENARLGAEKVMKYKRQVKELFDLVTKNDIGHPTIGDLPLMPNVLSLDRTNAQVKKLNEGIINMFAEPGQSQMMNTIIERQMQGAVVPSLATEPQLNKINAAVLRSNVEHLQQFPGFLERWQQTHNNTLDGAADAWVDYTEHNPRYIWNKDKRGNVKVYESNHVMPIDQWLKVGETGGIRKIGDKTFVRQQDGSWMEK